MDTFEEIAGNLSYLDDEMDRLEYISELGKMLPPLPAEDAVDGNKVHGCQSQVWIATKIIDTPSRKLVFSGTSDATTVRGLIAIAISLVSGRSPEDILNLDAERILFDLGLKSYLTSRRSSGLSSVIHRMKNDARAASASLSEDAAAKA